MERNTEQIKIEKYKEYENFLMELGQKRENTSEGDQSKKIFIYKL